MMSKAVADESDPQVEPVIQTAAYEMPAANAAPASNVTVEQLEHAIGE